MRPGQASENLAAADASKIDQISAAPVEVCRSPLLFQGGEDQIAARLEVERREDQFAKPG